MYSIQWLVYIVTIWYIVLYAIVTYNSTVNKLKSEKILNKIAFIHVVLYNSCWIETCNQEVLSTTVVKLDYSNVARRVARYPRDF